MMPNSAVSEEELDAARKGLYFGGKTQNPSALHWVVFALALDSGEVLWDREVYAGKPVNGIPSLDDQKKAFGMEVSWTGGQKWHKVGSDEYIVTVHQCNYVDL